MTNLASNRADFLAGDKIYSAHTVLYSITGLLG